jgi:hypothetical protein
MTYYGTLRRDATVMEEVDRQHQIMMEIQGLTRGRLDTIDTREPVACPGPVRRGVREG